MPQMQTVDGTCNALAPEYRGGDHASGMDVRQIAELELAFPTFAEAIGIGARQSVRTLGLEPPERTGSFEERPAMVSGA